MRYNGILFSKGKQRMSDLSKSISGVGEHKAQIKYNNFLNNVAVLVLTYNEAPNIQRTLDALIGFPEVVVLDSGSADDTVKIARRYPNVRIITRAFDTFADQCNFGLACISADWVLSLDADYVLSPELQTELIVMEPGAHIAFEASFRYFVNGRPLRGTLYPARRVLYRRDLAKYRNEGHGHRVIIEGSVGRLAGEIYHDDRKRLTRWFASQSKYAELEVDYLVSMDRKVLSFADKIRLLAWPAPFFVFIYTLLWKRCILDGWAGWFYVLQRTLAEIMIALEIIDRRRRDLK